MQCERLAMHLLAPLGIIWVSLEHTLCNVDLNIQEIVRKKINLAHTRNMNRNKENKFSTYKK
jgi:hypothetical protein